MDPLRFKRAAIQTQRQTTKTTFGNSPVVPRVSTVVPLSRQPMVPLQPTAPAIPTSPRLVRIDVSTRDRLRQAPQTQAPPIAPVAPTYAPPLAAPTSPIDSTPPSSATAAPRRLSIDMQLPGEESPSRFKSIKSFAGQRRFRLMAYRSLAVGVVLAITMGGLLFSQSYLKLHKVFKGGTATAEALKATVNPDLLKGEGRGRVNILLLGRGGGTHDAPDLTDTMMLVSIDPFNHTSTLLSVPRDLWVNVPNHGVMKLNAAWESGVFKYLGKTTTGSTNPQAISAGFKTVDSSVEEVLGLTIDYNVLVDFQAFKQAVDTIGGINLTVPTDLVDPTMAWENAHNPVLAKVGLQTFDGKHALMYARSRETTSDFARSERQRSLLVALKGKVATAGTLSNPTKLSGLISAFGNNVQTDLSIGNANRLYSIMHGVDDSQVSSIGLSDGANSYVSSGSINGQSVVLPKSGLFKYDDIQHFVRGQLKDPYITKEHAKIMVLNGTSTPNLATVKADELKSYGYTVSYVGNTPNTGWTQTTLIDLTHTNKYTKNYLEQRFGQKATSKLTDTTIPTNGADFVIIVGSDNAISTRSQP